MVEFKNRLWIDFEKLLRWIIAGLLKLIRKRLTEEQWDNFMQFVRFCLVGLTTTIISYIIYAVLVWIGAHYLIASVVSFIVSVAWSFLLNNRYVFKTGVDEKRVWWKTLLKTYVSYTAVGLVLANILLFLWVDVLGISEYIGPIINLLITIPLNYILNKFWAYRKKSETSNMPQS